MRTNNDYLADYVREQYPHIEYSLSFSIWKVRNVVVDFSNDIVNLNREIKAKLIVHAENNPDAK